jgi:hypothetical protein
MLNNLFFRMFLIILLPCVCHSYDPQIEVEYKGNTDRHIGRANILAPVWQKAHDLLYVDAIVMLDNAVNQEYSGGLGYRKIVKIGSIKSIIGGYGFYDWRYTTNKNAISQVTMGLELLNVIGEFRINGYKTLGKTVFDLSSSADGTVDISHDADNVYFGSIATVNQEIAMGGFDTEVGYKIPNVPVNVFGGYYYFSNKDIVDLHGPRGRIEYKPRAWLVLEGEYSHDDKRGHTWYGRIGVRFAMLAKKKVSSPFSIAGKMTQKPLRDIDVVTDEVDSRIPTVNSAVQVTSMGELIQAVQNGKSDPTKRDIAITGDLSANNVIITNQFGDRNSMLDGFRIMGVKLTKNGSVITNAEFHQRRISSYILRQDPTIPSFSEHGSDFFVPAGFIPYAKNTQIGYLILDDWSVDGTNGYDDRNGSGAGFVGYCLNCHVHHITNRADIRGFKSSGIIGFAFGTSKIHDNENTGSIESQGVSGAKRNAGIVQSAFGSTIISKNINRGEILGSLGAGIVNDVYNNVEVDGNINYGRITSTADILSTSSGILGVAFNSSIIKNNINEGEVASQNAGGILLVADDNAQVIGNRNTGNISGKGSGGIARDIQGDSIVRNNSNTGNITGIGDPGGGNGSSGIVRLLLGRGSIIDNTNTGTISGDRGAGIVTWMEGTEQKLVRGNRNTGTVSGDDSAGIVQRPQVGRIENNINNAQITGGDSAGIVHTLYSGLNPGETLVVTGNQHIGAITGANSQAIFRYGAIGGNITVNGNTP